MSLEKQQAMNSEIKNEDGYFCNICKKGAHKIEIHVHHIIPLYQFGTNNKNNLVVLCQKCHQKQHPDFKISKNLHKEKSNIESKNIEKQQLVKKNSHKIVTNEINVIVKCIFCSKKLRIPCGRWLCIRCSGCNKEFEAFGNSETRYETRPVEQ